MNNTRPDQALVGCRTNFMETLHYPKLAQPLVARLKTSPPPRPQAAPADGAFTFGKRFFRPERIRPCRG